MSDINRVFFVRVRNGEVTEKGVTDAPGFAEMEQQAAGSGDEYFSVSDPDGLVKDADITVTEFTR